MFKKLKSFLKSYYIFFVIIPGFLIGLAWKNPWFDILWVALAPIFLFLEFKVKSSKEAFFYTYKVFFIVFLVFLFPLTSLNWQGFIGETNFFGIVIPFQEFFIIAVYFLFCAIASVFYGFFGFIFYIQKRNHFLRLLTIPSAWVVFEFLRQFFIFKIPSGFFGYSVSCIYIKQIASYVGIYGLSFLIVFVNIGIFLFFKAVILKKRGLIKRNFYVQAIMPVFIVLAVLFGICIFGFVRFSQVKEIIAKGKIVKIAVLPIFSTRQAGIISSEFPFGEEADYLFKKAIKENPDIITMPERNSYVEMLVDPKRVDSYFSELLASAPSTKILVSVTEKSDGKSYSTLSLFGNLGVEDVYRKRYLFPFGEYRPKFLSFLLPPTKHEFLSSGNQPIIKLGNQIIAPLICQELLYSNLSRESVFSGGKFLFDNANPGIFENDKISGHLINIAGFRAIENQRSFLIVSLENNSYKIVLFNFLGEKVFEKSSSSEIDFISVPLADNISIYTRFGDLIVFVSLFVLIIQFSFYLKNRKKHF